MIILAIDSFKSFSSAIASLLLGIKKPASNVMVPSFEKHLLLILLIHDIHTIIIKLCIIHSILLRWKSFFINFWQIFRLIIDDLLLFLKLSFPWSISITRYSGFLRWWRRITLNIRKRSFLHVPVIFGRMTLLLIQFSLV